MVSMDKCFLTYAHNVKDPYPNGTLTFPCCRYRRFVDNIYSMQKVLRKFSVWNEISHSYPALHILLNVSVCGATIHIFTGQLTNRWPFFLWMDQGVTPKAISGIVWFQKILKTVVILQTFTGDSFRWCSLYFCRRGSSLFISLCEHVFPCVTVTAQIYKDDIIDANGSHSDGAACYSFIL